MSHLSAGKLAQACRLVQEAGVDVWLTFVRETSESADPVLPLLIEGGLTWQSALLIGRDGRKTAIVGNFDAEPLAASGEWDEVIPYVQGIRETLLQALERLVPSSAAPPQIAINWSLDDAKADGITHGMTLLLERILSGTRFEGSLVSAEGIIGRLRSCKTPEEIERIRGAIRHTEEILHEVHEVARPGRTEREIFDDMQARILGRGLGFSWDPRNDPIVNSGPDSMIGHGIPSDSIRIAPGHLFHIDIGVLHQGYASDLQRTWFVAERDGPSRGPGRPIAAEDAREATKAGMDVPEDVLRAFHAVHGAISAGAALLRPGIEGWRVDEAARRFIVSAGYPEYQHALGHQVGRMAHDGGAILGPCWERYGKTPTLPVEPDHVFTLELGVIVEGRGYLGLEEMVRVTESGVEWLSERQNQIQILI